MRIGWTLGVVAACLASFSADSSAQVRSPPPDYWKCVNRVGGSWVFGRAPSACDASGFGDDKVVWSKYGPLVFGDARASATETPRYLEEMHAVIRDASAHYLRRRKPRASPIEVVVFRRAILALAHQESYWTHYRLASDQRLKMMRGDSGHGHGLMQIDDRFHFARILAGEAWDLTGNLAYALDIYYAEWERAGRASCVARVDDYETRARAAYSAYNGGPAQLCRWTDPNHKWARNDEGFLQKFRGQTWGARIADLKKPAAFDVACELDGGSNCLSPGGGAVAAAPYRAFLDEREVGVCVDTASGAECVGEARDLACLPIAAVKALRFDLGADRALDGASFRRIDRHEMCARPALGILPVGAWVRARTDINLRATAGGGRLGVVQTGEAAQVLDFEARADESLTRHYRVRTEAGRIGWVFAGGVETQARYVEEAPPRPAGLIPLSRARIVAPNGINVRRTPAGEEIGWVPNDAVAEVVGVVARGANNEIYLRIAARDGVEGFIYSGRASPELTMPLWVKSEDGP